MGGEHDDGEVRQALRQGLLQCKAVNARHADVGDEAATRILGELAQERLGAIEDADFVAAQLEEQLQCIPDVGIVIDDVHPKTRGEAVRGFAHIGNRIWSMPFFPARPTGDPRGSLRPSGK